MRYLIMLLVLLFATSVFAYEPGYCPITGRQIISGGRTMPNYAIASFELDNGSIMPVAVDKDAVITEADFPRIMEYVKQGWLWEISRKNWTEEQTNAYKEMFFNLYIVRRI